MKTQVFKKARKQNSLGYFCISLLFILSFLTSCRNDVKNVARVNQTYITKQEFDNQLSFYTRFFTEKYGSEYLNKKASNGKTNIENLQNDILNSMIFEIVMLDDLEKNDITVDKNNINQIKDRQIKKLHGLDSLIANLNALDSSEEEYDNIMYYSSIKKTHEKFVKENLNITKEDIAERIKSDNNLQAQFTYDVFVFDNKNEANKVSSYINDYKDFNDFKNAIVKNYSVLTKNFVLSDDELLKKSNMYQELKVSKVFKIEDKYYILMIEEIDKDPLNIVNKVKSIIEDEEYKKYMRKIIRDSRINIFY